MHLNINDIGNTRIVIRITALLDAQPSHSRSIRLGQLYPELYGPSRHIKKKAAARFLRNAGKKVLRIAEPKERKKVETLLGTYGLQLES